MIDRIVGAFTFKKGVYAAAANDAAFSNNAWLIVLVAVLLNQLGSRAGSFGHSFIRWIIGTILIAVIGVGTFALGAYVIKWLSSAMFKVNVTFEQIVRSLGLSYIWKVVGLISILAWLPFLVCITTPIRILDVLVAFAAALFAVKETTNMEWLNTFIVTIIATVAGLIVVGVFGILFALVGL